MSDTAIIFPGQGAQSVGMGGDILEASAAARTIFERANASLGFDIAKICREGPSDDLERTDIQQPAIFVTSAAIWAAFCEVGASIDDYRFAGGLSLGEYTALYVAGAVDFEPALALVRRRGELMQQAANAVQSGMVSLIGADEAVAQQVCEKASEGEVLAPANLNCPGQVVIAGTKAACERAVQLAGELGCRAVPLAVAGAFHTDLMKPAADGLAEMLDATKFRRPRISVIANVNAEYHDEPAAIRESLRKQLTHPVLWHRCIDRLIADGAERFVEIGPGRILTGLMRKIDRTKTTTNISKLDSLQSAIATETR